MRYTVTTFKVRLEASEIGDRSGESDYVEKGGQNESGLTDEYRTVRPQNLV